MAGTWFTTELAWGSAPETDELISWAGLTVHHDGVFSRHHKIPVIKEFMTHHDVTLRVCSHLTIQTEDCKRCPKCLRTIINLLLHGIDPNQCGLKADRHSFAEIQHLLTTRKVSAYNVDAHWRLMQNDVRKAPADYIEYIDGFTDFLEWFTQYDLDLAVQRESRLERIYYALPYDIAQLGSKIITYLRGG